MMGSGFRIVLPSASNLIGAAREALRASLTQLGYHLTDEELERVAREVAQSVMLEGV